MLSACGFHLQGSMQLSKPLQKICLESPEPFGHLSQELKQYLKMSQVQLMTTPEQADTTLTILSDDTKQTLLGVSSTQQTRQYLLTTTVIFEIKDRRGLVLFGPETLSESRAITIQSNQILGSSNEASLLYQQMRRHLAYSMMNRLASKEVSRAVNKTTPSLRAKRFT